MLRKFLVLFVLAFLTHGCAYPFYTSDTQRFYASEIATHVVLRGLEVEKSGKWWPFEFEVGELRACSLFEGEQFEDIRSHEMLRRAASIGANLNLFDASKILADQSNLSSEFDGTIILLTGTILRDKLARSYIGFLKQNDDGDWRINYIDLDRLWFRKDFRLACTPPNSISELW